MKNSARSFRYAHAFPFDRLPRYLLRDRDATTSPSICRCCTFLRRSRSSGGRVPVRRVGYGVAACASGTITVCAVPYNSMLLHDGGRGGIESGPLNFS